MSELAATIDQQGLASVWRRLRRGDPHGIRLAADDLICNFPPPEDGYEEDENFIYLPVSVLVSDEEAVRQDNVTFALGERILVTIEPATGFAAFDRAALILKRRPELPRDAHGVMFALLQASNSAANQIIELASSALEGMSHRIREVTEGVDDNGREINTDDISQSLAELNDREELVSRILEGQLLLERAARYLRAELGTGHADLRGHIETLISDIGSLSPAIGDDQPERQAEPGGQGLHHHHRGVPAADADRDILRDEFRGDARAELGMGLHRHHPADPARGAAAALVHQAQGLAAVKAPYSRKPGSIRSSFLSKAGQASILASMPMPVGADWTATFSGVPWGGL
jgi:CorA-like Mg2+ transporter protein